MLAIFNNNKFHRYLYELESALSFVGIRDCADMKDDSQLSAVIFAFLRAASLFRATLLLLDSGLMDAGDVMRRAYWEAWMLGYEFRIKSAARHSALWHREKNKHGLPVIKRVTSFEKVHGVTALAYGASYSGLSEVSHPTKSAAENSIVTVNIIHGGDQSQARAVHETITEQDLPSMLYMLIWTVVVEATDLISTGVKLEAIPMCAAFFNQYQSDGPEAPPD